MEEQNQTELHKEQENIAAQAQADTQEGGQTEAQTSTNEAEATPEAPLTTEEQLTKAEEEIAKMKDQLLRQMAEFDNYRKRTIKEKSELILGGGQRVLESLLPVLDDLDRAKANMDKASEIDVLREGVDLIIDKLTKALAAHGLKRIDTDGATFDTDYHEAIAITPAPEEALKNHIIDCVQPGYLLGEKVIRHAKVVVGQ